MPDTPDKDLKPQDSTHPKKKMTNEEIWLKIIADQKLIREARQQGLSYQEISEKYGFVFKTV